MRYQIHKFNLEEKKVKAKGTSEFEGWAQGRASLLHQP